MDTLCLKSGILSPVIAAVSFGGGGGAFEVRTNQSQLGAAAGRASDAISVENPAAEKAAPRRLLFGFPLRYLWPGGVRKRGNGVAIDDAVLVDDRGKAAVGSDPGLGSEGKDESWVLKILHVRSRGTEQGKVRVEDLEKKEEGEVCDTLVNGDEEEDEEECDVCRVDEEREEEEIKFDRESFSRLLRRVTLTEAKFYAQMSYLGNLAYSIPNIKARNLLRYYKLRFVTSSMEKKGLSTKSEEDQTSMGGAEAERNPKEAEECKDEKNSGYRINASAAYQIAASAASYLHYHTKSILPFNSSKGKACEEDNEITTDSVMKSDVASFMATSDSVTAVVAAKEEVKQAVADDLNSTFSSPCEWFICDDDQRATRFFVIQGSESLASWQANLLFEPIQFEGLDVLVHRGIYEAAKGIYEQMLPEVRSHVRSHGNRATFRFTGHSLGGSLALLVNLMLLTRGEVPLSLLLPVITFGSPSIICGGDRLLRKLGLPRSHVQAITMHRDIVPRAFSCNYPSHVAELLKAINGNFRNHPCLNHQSLLYTPMGELLILQPEEKFSPHHHLLPSGSGIYLLSSVDAQRQIVAAAQMAFLNSPHPLEILHDRSSYGSDGTIQRDHDMNSYVKCIQGVVRKELNHVRKAKREHRRKLWWPLVMSSGRPLGFNRTGSEQVTFSGVLQTGRQSFKRFTRLVASQHMHLLVVLMLPARLFVLGAFTGITFFQ